MISRQDADTLLKVGHGVGILTARAMLHSHETFRQSDIIVCAQQVADAYREDGEPHVADAVEQFIRDQYGDVAPPIESRGSQPRQITSAGEPQTRSSDSEREVALERPSMTWPQRELAREMWDDGFTLAEIQDELGVTLTELADLLSVPYDAKAHRDALRKARSTS